MTNAKPTSLLLALLALALLVAAPAPLRADPCGDCMDKCKKEGDDCKKAAPKALCKVPGVKGICTMFKNAQCPAAEKICRSVSCETMPSCDPPEPGDPGGRISGEPHFYSLDRARFDLQAVGEFLVARSEAADLELQARLAPYGKRTSVMSVLAVRAGDHVIAFARGEGVTVDGEPVEVPEDGLYVDAGLLIRPAKARRYVVLAGTTSVWVRVGGTILDLDLRPGAETRGQWVGLLGDFDGKADNDFRTRDGAVIDPEALTAETLYGKFADSFRLSQGESFLPYGKGETTETFTDRSFPEQHVQLTDLDEETFEKARGKCAAAGVRGAEAMRNCIYDLGATGSDEFIASYLGNWSVEAALSISYQGELAMRVQDRGSQGEEVSLFWTGSPGASARVSIVDDQAKRVSSRSTRGENPILVRLPTRLGTYTVSFEQDGKSASQSIEVVPVTASIKGPATVGGAEVAEISWSGPMRQGDHIAFMKAGATTPRDKLAYLWATSGEGSFQAPATPGTYEIWYVLEGAGGREAIARHTISVGEPSASLDGPAEVGSGASFPVSWTGPGGSGDFVQIATAKQASTENSIHYEWARLGESAVEMRAPSEPGRYELRYVATTVAGREILARRPFAVAATHATLEAPETVTGGDTFELSWKGPLREGDFIALLEAGATSERDKLGYVWAKDGKGSFKAPPKPGRYELWYVLQGADGRQDIARHGFTVTQGTATLEAPTEVEIGAFFPVQWTGPGGKGDFIQIVEPKQAADGSRSIHHARAKSGEREVELRAPVEAGSYELRYIAETVAGRSSFTSRPIRVVPTTATLEAPREVTAGASFEVSWKGPSRRGDFVDLVKQGEADPGTHIDYVHTHDKSQGTLDAPAEPGRYEARYILQGSDRRKILTRVQIRVTAP